MKGDIVEWGIFIGVIAVLIGILMVIFFAIASGFWGIVRKCIVGRISHLSVIKEEIIERWVVGGLMLVLVLSFHIAIGKYFFGSIIVITKPISGIVVDKETGKPIEGAYVDASWSGSIATVGGPVSYEIAHKVVRTNKDGKFYFPRLFRFAFFRYYDSMGVSAYASGYKYAYHPTPLIKPEDEFKELKNVRFELEPIKTIEEFAKQCSVGGSINENERRFLIEEGKRFLELYPNSRYTLEVHYHLAYNYTCLEEWDDALREYQRIVELYPISLYPTETESRYIEWAKKDMEDIKKYGRIR